MIELKQSGVHALCFALYMAIVLAAFAAFAALFLSLSGPYDNDGQTLFFAAYTTMPLSATMILIAGLHIRLLVCGLIIEFSTIF